MTIEDVNIYFELRCNILPVKKMNSLVFHESITEPICQVNDFIVCINSSSLLRVYGFEKGIPVVNHQFIHNIKKGEEGPFLFNGKYYIRKILRL